MSNEELKPCPFCGSAAHLLHDPIGLATNARVHCMAEGCRADVWSDQGKDAAIGMWNRRAAPQAPAPGASIDTPEFRTLLSDYVTRKAQLHEGAKVYFKGMISHIDAKLAQHGQERYEAAQRDKDGNHVDDLRIWLDESQAALENANTALWSTSLKLQEAEASLARLVEGVRGLSAVMDAPATPENKVALLKAVEFLIALLPAKADKPEGGA